MTIGNFLLSFLSVLNAMSPYLLLGFLIAGVLHVFVPKRFYAVEGMHCNHCKAAVEQSVGKLKGVETCEATPAANTLVVTGTANENDVRKAVEQAGFEFKGVK